MMSTDFPPASADLAARGISFRPAGPGDRDLQFAVYAAGRRDEMALTGWPSGVVQAFLADQFRLQTDHFAAHYRKAARLIVQVDGADAGRLILHRTTSEIRVVEIGLLPDYQGRGIGGTILAAVQAHAAATGCGVVSLHADIHGRARRLYARLGFKEIEERGVRVLMEWSADPVDTGPPGQPKTD